MHSTAVTHSTAKFSEVYVIGRCTTQDTAGNQEVLSNCPHLTALSDSVNETKM
jgi:hypothetical protein